MTSYVVVVEYVSAASVSVVRVVDIKSLMSHTLEQDVNVGETLIGAVHPLMIL